MNRVLGARWIAGLMSRLDRALEFPFGPTAHDGPLPGEPRVLVADDNPADLEYAGELLECCGAAPTLASDGAEAVALACQGDFDLILMDMQMPVLDGLEATKRIRVHEHQQLRARAPVLAYTSCVLEEDVLRGCGVDGVLAKPCSEIALQECLRRWCGPRSGADP